MPSSYNGEYDPDGYEKKEPKKKKLKFYKVPKPKAPEPIVVTGIRA